MQVPSVPDPTVISRLAPAAVLVAGSANLDFVVRADRIPAPGETVLGHNFQTFAGGKGANQAVACARAGGVTTHLLLALGEDDAAAQLQASLSAAGVVQHVVRAPQRATGVAFICVADDAQNAITVAPGANADLLPQHLPALQGFSHLLLQLETPVTTVQAYAQAARAAGLQVVLNAAPAQRLPQGVLAAVDVLVVNETELMRVTGRPPPTTQNRCDRFEISHALQLLAVPTVVVTLGAQGCVALHRGQLLQLPAFVVQAVDTTAAGDTFCGALVAALAQGLALPEALLRASAAAACACTRAGAQTSIPTRAQVDELLRQHAQLPPLVSLG